MAAIKETFLMCDKCNVTFGVDNRQYNSAQQRKSAKNNGWQYSGNKDYCPDCRAKNKDGNVHASIILKLK